MLNKRLPAVALAAAVGFALLATPAAARAQYFQQYSGANYGNYNGGWHGGTYGTLYRNGFYSGRYWAPNTYVAANGRTYIGTYSYPGYQGGSAPYGTGNSVTYPNSFSNVYPSVNGYQGLYNGGASYAANSGGLYYNQDYFNQNIPTANNIGMYPGTPSNYPTFNYGATYTLPVPGTPGSTGAYAGYTYYPQ
jgi:hypothetical protein